jgi:hypothetical protein
MTSLLRREIRISFGRTDVHETSFWRAALALGAGAAIVAAVSSAIETAYFTPGDQPYNNVSRIGFFFARSAVWLYIWLLGMMLFAVPPWVVLHRLKLRRWVHAMCLGFTVVVLVMLLPAVFQAPDPPGSHSWASDGGRLTMVDGLLTPYGWSSLAVGTVSGGVEAALVGLLIWRLAYRKRI